MWTKWKWLAIIFGIFSITILHKEYNVPLINGFLLIGIYGWFEWQDGRICERNTKK